MIGTAFAAAIGAEYVDGDDLHPAGNVAKMASGEPLGDDDRKPWLAVIAELLKSHGDPIVVGCSSLKRRYRDWIREGAGGGVTFLHLAGDRDVIARRMAERNGHFMPLSLLDSQFEALEPPEADENAVTVNIDQAPKGIVSALLKATGKEEL